MIGIIVGLVGCWWGVRFCVCFGVCVVCDVCWDFDFDGFVGKSIFKGDFEIVV